MALLLCLHVALPFQPIRAMLLTAAPTHGDPAVPVQAADGPIMSGSTSPLSMSSHALSPFSNSPRHSSGVLPCPCTWLMLHSIGACVLTCAVWLSAQRSCRFAC